jgi:hypothetical protein
VVDELARESSRGKNRSQEARRESFYGRIAAHGEDLGTWPPCSEMLLGGGSDEAGPRVRGSKGSTREVGATGSWAPRVGVTERRKTRARLTWMAHMSAPPAVLGRAVFISGRPKWVQLAQLGVSFISLLYFPFSPFFSFNFEFKSQI